MKTPTFSTHPTVAPDNKTIAIALPLNRYKSAWMFASAEIVRETEKAIQVSHPDTNIKIWFPKSALQHDTRSQNFDPTREYNYIVADWFRGNMSIWHDKFFETVGSFIG